MWTAWKPLTRVVAAALLMAGCISTTDDPPLAASTSPEPAEPPARASEILSGNSTWTLSHEGLITGVGAGAVIGDHSLCCVSAHHVGEGISGTFPLGPDATRIVLVLTWLDALVDLDLHVAAPDYAYFFPPELDPTAGQVRDSSGTSEYNRNGTLAQPDGVARIEVSDLAALQLVGEWAWEVRSKTAYETTFQMNVTVEYAQKATPE